MKDFKSDAELIGKVALEITARFKTLLTIISDEEKELLRHVAAASIHMAILMGEVSCKANGMELSHYDTKKMYQEFLNECGCGVFNEVS